jgi:hypothetical protein
MEPAVKNNEADSNLGSERTVVGRPEVAFGAFTMNFCAPLNGQIINHNVDKIFDLVKNYNSVLKFRLIVTEKVKKIRHF